MEILRKLGVGGSSHLRLLCVLMMFATNAAGLSRERFIVINTFENDGFMVVSRSISIYVELTRSSEP